MRIRVPNNAPSQTHIPKSEDLAHATELTRDIELCPSLSGDEVIPAYLGGAIKTWGSGLGIEELNHAACATGMIGMGWDERCLINLILDPCYFHVKIH